MHLVFQLTFSSAKAVFAGKPELSSLRRWVAPAEVAAGG